MSKQKKIVVYTQGHVISQMVRDAISGEDFLNYHKEVRRFFESNPNLKVGQTVVFACVEMRVIKINSSRLKLEVI